MLDWLPREELTLMVGAIAALGLLALGVFELLWPAGVLRARRRVRPAAPSTPPPRVFGAVPSTPLVSAERLLALVERARAETDPERRTSALRVAILTLERWRGEGNIVDDAVGLALQRARAELWADYQRIALGRLGSATPWRSTAVRAGDAAR